MTAQQNQTFIDIAIMASGTIESLFTIVQANGKSITDAPVPGDDYIIPGDIVRDNDTLQYLMQNSSIIGTKGQAIPQGIGYWMIQTDFTIS